MNDKGIMMQRYADNDGDSGIVAYEIRPDAIVVEFAKGRYRFYEYSYASAGQANVEQMKHLAKAGDGLNAFIIKNKIKFANKS